MLYQMAMFLMTLCDP